MAKKSPKDQSINIQQELTSVTSQIALAIREGFMLAATEVDEILVKRIGKSLTTSLSALEKFTESAANNSFKIKSGLLGSEEVTKQLLSLEEKRLSTERLKTLAIQNKIPFNQKEADLLLKSIKDQEKLLEIERDALLVVEDKIGLTGKLASSLSQIPGLGKLIDAKGLEQELRAAAVQVDEFGNITETNIGKIGMMAKGFTIVGKQIKKNLLDPLTITNFLVDQFFDINKASVDLQRLTGQLGTNMDIFANGAASAKDILEVQSEITKQIGLNAQNAFSYDILANAADLKVEMGLAAEEAGAFALVAQTSGIEVDSLVDSVVATTSAFNGANRTAVSQGQILKDVANTANSIKLSLGNNPKALAEAASQARRLGVDLNELNNIANNLLDFESSIEKELEAQLLTGTQINLSKARELALNNDLKGVGEELFKNTVDIQKFGKMNRLQQEAQAAALGMTRDQLAQVAYQRGIEAKMTAEQAAEAAGVEASDMRRLTIQENFNAALNKLTAILAPVMEMVGELLSVPLFGPLAAGVVVALPVLGTLAQSLSSIIGLFTANTAAQAANTTATVAQTTANTALAGSNTTVATTGTATAGVFSRMGVALGSFGASAAAAIPVLLSIGAVAAGIGVAFLGVAQALKTIPEILKLITVENTMGLLAVGPALMSMAAGLAAVAVAGPLALPILLGLTAAGLLAGTSAIVSEVSPIQTNQESPQAISLEPVVNELKLLRQEATYLLKKLVDKDTSSRSVDWDATKRDMNIFSYTS